MATLVGGVAQPAPLEWAPTPLGPDNAVLYTAEQAGGTLWSVGINLEPGKEGTLKFHPLAERWDGVSWQQTVQPMADGRLDDVLARAANDAWAVGATEQTITEPMRPVLQHWTGDAWSLVDAPAGAPGENAQFTTVAAQGDDLLIGRYGDQASVLRYAHGRWQELPREGLEHIVYLDDLKAVSGKEIWAAGIGGVARYDGTRWTKVDLPVDMPADRQFEVAQLVVKSADDIWAVGEKPDLTLWRRPLALHYDGKAWTEISAPSVTGQFHDLDFVDGKAVAIGGNPDTGAPLIAELGGDGFVPTTTPPGAGYLHGSVQTGRCIWTVGVSTETVNNFEKPYAAVGKHRPDAGHGALPTC
ncbi:hypothetical protein [Kribbella sp. NPDC049227]|uniref:hypothetical protein n=1 Tax=Kribbella sp. NPDC049227 TaxID=3364113 RepID=UPI003710853A